MPAAVVYEGVEEGGTVRREGGRKDIVWERYSSQERGDGGGQVG